MPHHLLGHVPLSEVPWTVGKYAAEAKKVLKDVQDRGKIPIVVGGTAYYLQALALTGETVREEESYDASTKTEDRNGKREDREEATVVREKQNSFQSVEDEEAQWPILRENTEVLLEELRKVDPAMAARWHPQDHRKIRRSLAVYLQNGRRASEIYAEQQAEREQAKRTHLKNGMNGSTADPSEAELNESAVLRHDTLFFYLHSDSSSLNRRLEARIQKMLSRGLLDEIRYIRRFHSSLVSKGEAPDLSRGIWVAIGYKEFAPYLDSLEAEEASSQGVDATKVPLEQQDSLVENERDKHLARLKAQCIERMVIATRQYARSQGKWVKGKLFSALRSVGAQGRLFVLDASDPDRFAEHVSVKAADVASRFLAGEDLPTMQSVFPSVGDFLPLDEDVSGGGGGRGRATRELRTCEMCGVCVVMARDWELHLKSKKHRRASKGAEQRFGAEPTERCREIGEEMR